MRNQPIKATMTKDDVTGEETIEFAGDVAELTPYVITVRPECYPILVELLGERPLAAKIGKAGKSAKNAFDVALTEGEQFTLDQIKLGLGRGNYNPDKYSRRDMLMAYADCGNIRREGEPRPDAYSEDK